MSAYSKLIAVIVANVVGIALVALSYKGLATCPAGPESCTVFGFTYAQANATVMALLTSIGVYIAPAND